MSNFRQNIEERVVEIKTANQQAFTVLEGFEKMLTESEAFEQVLRTGNKIPDFILPNAYGKLVNIKDLYKEKYLVLVFYRGHWCPFCNLQLMSLQRHLEKIGNRLAHLVAVSPQTPGHSIETMAKLNLKFEVLSDIGNKVGKMFNLVYALPEYLNKAYMSFGVDIQHYNGRDYVELPFPATYIVNKNGIILKDYIGASLNDRVDPAEVIDFLSQLQQ